MRPDLQSFAVAAGLVVVALVGLVVVWKITKSLVTLLLWLVLGGVVLGAAWWLLAREGLIPGI